MNSIFFQSCGEGAILCRNNRNVLQWKWANALAAHQFKLGILFLRHLNSTGVRGRNLWLHLLDFNLLPFGLLKSSLYCSSNCLHSYPASSFDLPRVRHLVSTFRHSARLTEAPPPPPPAKSAVCRGSCILMRQPLCSILGIITVVLSHNVQCNAV